MRWAAGRKRKLTCSSPDVCRGLKIGQDKKVISDGQSKKKYVVFFFTPPAEERNPIRPVRSYSVTWADAEDFLCEVRSDGEAKDGLSVSVEAARRDPENGVVTLTLRLAYAPLRTCRLAHFVGYVRQRLISALWL